MRTWVKERAIRVVFERIHAMVSLESNDQSGKYLEDFEI